MCTQDSSPQSLAASWGSEEDCYGPFERNFQGHFFFLMIPNQKVREIGDISPESRRQIFEVTRRIQDPVEFMNI